MNIYEFTAQRTSDNEVALTFCTDDYPFTITWSNIHAGDLSKMKSYQYTSLVPIECESQELEDMVHDAMTMGDYRPRGEYHDLYLKILDEASTVDFNNFCVVKKIGVADGDESDNLENSTINVEFNTGDTLSVPLTGGKYKPSQGCLVLSDGYQAVHANSNEQDKYQCAKAIELAEKYYKDQIEKKL